MKISFLALALAFGLAGSLAGVARAEDQPLSQPMPDQTAQAPSRPTENAALQDYNAGINPNWNIPIAGPYDQSDRYIGPGGVPLPGWGAVNGQGGDSGGG